MNAIVMAPTADQSSLVATIERARALLDDGDLVQARVLAGTAYDLAKVGVSFATRAKASEQLIDKARRLQMDALLIESRAKMQIADAWDDAGAQGLVLKGRPKSVSDGNAFTAEQAGLSRKEIFEARKLCAAEKQEPGIVERAIAARVEAGFEPSRAALKRATNHAIGTRSRSTEERGNNAYFSPVEAVRVILALESFGARIKEPACGKGAISKPFEDAGYDVLLSDIVDYGTATSDGEVQQVGDFLQSIAGETVGEDIVTNPPYGKEILNRFIAHAMREHKPRKMALLLNLNFLCGCKDPDRLYAMEENPPSRVYVFARRLPMMHQEDWVGNEASSQMNTAWFVWERNDQGGYGDGYPQLIRVDWKNFETAPALLPGAGGNVAPGGLSFRAVDDEFKRSTPFKTLEQRVADWREAARTHLTARTGGVTADELRREMSLRSTTIDGIINQFVSDGFLSPADCDGRHQVLAGKGD